MTIEGINVENALSELEATLDQETDLSPALRSMIGVLMIIVKLLTNRVGLNSKNSSKPPSTDPNRLKASRKKTGRKPGAQIGHKGTTLKQVDDPDDVKTIKVDRRTLPKGHYKDVGYEKRQVFDIYDAEGQKCH